jgi:prevent-host-death family protein
MNQPITDTMKISDVRSNINSLVNEVYRHEKRVIVEKSGIPVAEIVSLEDIQRLDQIDEKRKVHDRVIEEIRAAFKDVPPEQLERESERALAEVRAEKRAERSGPLRPPKSQR